jgi:hypothetical protein
MAGLFVVIEQFKVVIERPISGQTAVAPRTFSASPNGQMGDGAGGFIGECRGAAGNGLASEATVTWVQKVFVVENGRSGVESLGAGANRPASTVGSETRTRTRRSMSVDVNYITRR